MIIDTVQRTLVKTLSWRIIAVVITFTTLAIVTKEAAIAVGLLSLAAVGDGIVKFFIYFFHESIWKKINFGRNLEETEGCCLWLTGLPCSGKTTIALELKRQLEKQLKRVEYLDGDVVRKLPNWSLGFSKKDRNENIERITRISSYLSQKAITICSFVSPYKEARDFIKTCVNNPIEVFIDAPVEVCAKRDVKGMYAKAYAGEIKGFTGVDDPYERPEDPDLVCLTDEETVKESVDKIMEYLKERRLI